MRLSYSDHQKVYTLLSRDDIFWSARDGNQHLDDLQSYINGLLLNRNAYLLMPEEGMIFFFWPINSVTDEMHVAMETGKRGKAGFKGVVAAVAWLFNNTKCESLMTYIPEHHQPAIMFAAQCGFRKKGKLEKSFFYDDGLQDLFIFGATKEELFNYYGVK